jgi:hypothetical protein
MPIFDDKNFEQYLKSFRPLCPDPLPEVRSRRVRVFRSLTWAGAAAMAALMIAAGVHDWKANGANGKGQPTVAASRNQSLSLTVLEANSLLAKPQSFKATLDEVALHSKREGLRPGQQSALSVLGKEEL